MYYLYLFLAFLTGVAASIQAGVNAQLRLAFQNPVLAAMTSFGAGFVTLVGVQLLLGGAVPSLGEARQISWWKWTGGVIGAFYVTTIILAVPRIGPANLLSLSVAGQLVAAVVLDHFGLLGFAQHPANGWRLLGVALIVTGAALVVRN
jgi:bacterial/archaeal transporter family-2 protein